MGSQLPKRAASRAMPVATPREFVLSLFITGATPNSARAIKNIKRICEGFIPGRYQLDIVDLYQQPAKAAEEQVIAAPTLLKSHPLPVRRIIGDMSNEQRVLAGLGIIGAG